MGMFDFLKPKKKPVAKIITRAPAAPKSAEKSKKEQANENNEPYVEIVGFNVDPKNLHQGSFELDWNEKFVADLVRAGYMIKQDDTDIEIVDRWFQTICRHVVMETWEQEQAMNTSRFIQERDIGNGRREIS
jgi:hypothetical protein